MVLQSLQDRLNISVTTQRTRRVLAVLMFIGLPASYGWKDVSTSLSAPRWIEVPVWFGLAGLTFVCWFALAAFARDRWTMSRNLDERQRQLRDRAVVISYAVLLVLVTVAIMVVAFVVVFLDHDLTLNRAVVQPVSGCLLLLALLPLAVLAWIEPDPLEDA